MNNLGDHSRLTFNPTYSRVLLQQGRVLLDADFNEQSAIHWHYLRTLAQDLGGPHWGPRERPGFAIAADGQSFRIGPGTYYVLGTRCVNDAPEGIAYEDQPGFPFPDSDELEAGKSYLVYLEAWERHISSIEDDSIREVALGGPDTCVRAQIVWQVKAREFAGPLGASYRDFLQALMGLGVLFPSGQLRARAGEPAASDKPCVLSPEARYRGAENQLYRVQVHRGGPAGTASFKWCRDNSVNFALDGGREGRVVTLEHLGRDARLGLSVGDWVELVDDHQVLRSHVEPLLEVEAIDAGKRQVTLSAEPQDGKLAADPDLHPQLRRWDQKAGEPAEGGVELGKDGTITIEHAEASREGFVPLEDGIEVEFRAPDADFRTAGHYRSGDYWLIPARTATGDVEWPRDETGSPQPAAPHGVRRSYAPLALVGVGPNGGVGDPTELRRRLIQTWE